MSSAPVHGSTAPRTESLAGIPVYGFPAADASVSHGPQHFVIRIIAAGLLGRSRSNDLTLCTDDIDDIHLPELSGCVGSQGEWDPNQATSRASLREPCPWDPSSPITGSLQTVLADTQASCPLHALFL